jgi:hypothetical protein
MINIPSVLNKLLNQAKSLVMEELNPDVTSGQSMPETNPGEIKAETQPIQPPQPVPKKTISWIRALTAIFNGIGVGVLLGILLGLSISPVVSGVIATLSGLLAVLLGLNEQYLDPLKSIRIGAFGLATVAGVLFGLYIRAHDPFSPTLLDKKKMYIELGFSEKEAKAFIMKTVAADSVAHKEDDNVLFSSSVKIGDCKILKRTEISDDAYEIINTFDRAGGTWAEFAKEFEAGLPHESVGKALITMRECFCESSSDGTIEMSNLAEIRKLGENSSVEQIEELLSSSASGQNWNTIVKKVRENFPAGDNKALYLLIIKVLSHD